jgi:FlaA1/EpsC-like NDP-sugar epimerase
MVKRLIMAPSGYVALSTRLLLRLPSFQRKLILSGLDAIAIVLSVWLSIWLRLAHPFPPEIAGLAWLLIAAPLMGLSIYALTANYRSLTRYTGSLFIYRIAFRNALLVLSLAMLGLLFRLPLPPRSSWILLWLLVTILTGSLRFVLRDLLLFVGRVCHGEALRVVIYGAGSAGVKLAHALSESVSHRISFFVDDSPLLWNREINGVPILPPQVLHERAASVDQVLLAIPSLSRSQRRHIVDAMQSLDLLVLQVPSIVDITSGLARIDALRPIAIEDLLGRDPVLPDPEAVAAALDFAGAQRSQSLLPAPRAHGPIANFDTTDSCAG